MHIRSKLFVYLLVSCPLWLVSQVSMTKLSNITVDGLEDKEWGGVEWIQDFHQHLPTDTSDAQAKTEVKVAYNNNYFYVFARCFELNKGKPIVQSLKRDFSFPRTDAFAIFLDPYNDGGNGFSFGCNPYGSQREGLLQFGGRFGVTTTWDNKWASATNRTDSCWTVEMAIPFTSLRYNENNKLWKINFSRNDQKSNETSTWIKVPRNLNVANLAYTGELIWSENPPQSGKNISIIPYVTSGVNKGDSPFLDAGLDAKIGITSSLNLDLTVNPDFSTVEVDRQVTNLDRFEIFFPERRQFFIENADLFSTLGEGSTRPFFSRRIGIGVDSSGAIVENPILGGARLSGKINNNWRVGLLAVQTGNKVDENVNPENFSVLSFQRKIGRRSNWGAFVVNKERFTNNWRHNQKSHNRVLGTDFNLLTADAKWAGKAYFHSSLDSSQGLGVSQGANISYNTRNFRAGVNQELVTEDFNAEAGFIRRKNYFFYRPFVEYLFFPEKGKLIFHGSGLRLRQFLDLGFNKVERELTGYYTFKFKNTSSITASYLNTFLRLRRDFDPSGTGGRRLEAGDELDWQNVELEYLSNERKSFFVDITAQAGQYFNGHRYGVDGSLRYRIVPKFVFSLNYSYNHIVLPSSFNSSDLVLLGPELEVLFTNKIFWTTFLQYNQQRDNINVNSRFQWRFKPASDLFVVYTDNYLPENLNNKSRGVVVKFTYWFNI